MQGPKKGSKALAHFLHVASLLALLLSLLVLASLSPAWRAPAVLASNAPASRAPQQLRPSPLLCPRRLFASGFNARQHVSSVYPKPAVWTWTRETERAFKAIYDEVQRGSRCKRAVYVKRFRWGLMSSVRDTMNLMLQGILDGQTVLFGKDAPWCPEHRERDPYMYCFFRSFSGCGRLQKAQRAHSSFRPDVWMDERLDEVWARLERRGLRLEGWPAAVPEAVACRVHKARCGGRRRKDYVGREQNISREMRERQARMSVLRALLARQVFKPSKLVQEKLASFRREMGEVPSPMLVVHARRTDKRFDTNIDRMLPQELARGHKKTLSVLAKLVAAAERLSGAGFRAIYFMSDDMKLARDETALQRLSRAGKHRPRVYTTPFNISQLLTPEYYTEGHDVLRRPKEVELDLDMLAGIFWAAERGSYIVGNGRSGVSQFLAQLMGAKFRMDPNWLSLWEDDDTLLGCLPETQNISWLFPTEDFRWTKRNSTQMPS